MREQTAFERFRGFVHDDPILEHRLRTIMDWETFVPEAISAASDRGIELGVGELEAARQAALLEWLARWA